MGCPNLYARFARSGRGYEKQDNGEAQTRSGS